MGGGSFPSDLENSSSSSSSNNKKSASSKFLFKKVYPVDPRDSAFNRDIQANGWAVMQFPDPMHQTWELEMTMYQELPQKPHLKQLPLLFGQDAIEEVMKLYKAGVRGAVLKIPECFSHNDQVNLNDSLDKVLPRLMKTKKKKKKDNANGEPPQSFSLFYVKETSEDME